MHALHPLHRLLAGLLLFGGLLGSQHADAAQSYDNCSGFIDSLPATINTQGVWCLRKNLSTTISPGHAITIAANNVTIDCNDFKVGGLGAGETTLTFGIYSDDRQNVTIRHCGIRGFYRGISLQGGSGHLVEDNRLDGNTFVGLYVSGENNLVRRNRVYDTGGSRQITDSYGVVAYADVIENVVDGVLASSYPGSPDGNATGILVHGDGHDVRGNRVRGMNETGAGDSIGISASGDRSTFSHNRIANTASTTGTGFQATGNDIFCTYNTVTGFASSYNACDKAFGNQ